MDTVIAALQDCNLSASQFIISILQNQQYNGHHLVEDLLVHCNEIFDAFIEHTSPTREQYIREIKLNSSEEGGWHFGPSHTTTQQVEDFSVKEMDREMQSCAPALWDLLGHLLGADDSPSCEAKDTDGDVLMGNMLGNSSRIVHEEDDSYWDDLDEIDLEGFINGLTSCTTPDDSNKQTLRHAAIITIVSIAPIFTMNLNK
ncbi:uncharacterized protein EDB91DRAFT_1061580 [Suillus paluster]|uniref:uncharacterized protein n=1 Tax=Suillus paluster TaxID=48578 RepID=UPI001B86A27C|nr:uncharacterized protein EDB91DRAFT_1061580 [Suillus paluster]KAG1726519.1 hypothetical protein EDB91DRAFT_1061580 [Suillus paluster]